MIDTSYKKKFLTINQIWYPKQTAVSELLWQKRKADILFVHGAQEKEAKGAFRGFQEYHTCMSDLTHTEDELLSAINKNVRYECRRSERDGVEIRFYAKADIEADKTLLESFTRIYEEMYRSKGIDTRFNITAVKKYMQTDSILFSAVWHEGSMIVFHSYIYDDTDARLLHSASCYRGGDENAQSMTGRANKRLHWEDMKYFKSRGLLRYDWGGISDFEKPNGIDEFKLKFGGEKITYYNVFAGNTLLGKLAVAVMKAMGRIE